MIGSRGSWVVWTLVLAVGCPEEPDPEGRLCTAALPCPPPFRCGPDGRCHRGSIDRDSGAPRPTDAEPRDAGAFDAEPLDADQLDAEPLDADPLDADPLDADPIDADPLDADPIDADPPDSGVHQLAVAIAASEDDALEDPSGPVLVSHGWISLYSLNHWGATRFQIPDIPRSALIQSAYIDVFVDSDTEDVPNILIRTEPTPAPAPLSTMDFDISTRVTSLESVVWAGPDTGAGWQRSPDLSSLVQAVIDRPDWTPGSHLLFIWDTQGPELFEFRQWDNTSGTFEAVLTIRYAVP